MIYIVTASSGSYDDYHKWNVKAFADKSIAARFMLDAEEFRKKFSAEKLNEIEDEFYNSAEYEEIDFVMTESCQQRLKELQEPFFSPFDGSLPDKDFNGFVIEEIEFIDESKNN